ncbi:MAG: polyhydroxyalkanoic acid system family protein [Ignavibacteriae bacterium]|nr:polyhydroxyalkanoic acid system family protein [Ignavibacteriota bacterium]
MPKLEINIPHSLTKDEALTRIKTFLPQLKEQNSDKIKDLEESWNGNTGEFKFKISGFKVSGTLQVGENFVLINGELPFVALLFRSTIEETIRTKAMELLEKK